MELGVNENGWAAAMRSRPSTRGSSHFLQAVSAKKCAPLLSYAQAMPRTASASWHRGNALPSEAVCDGQERLIIAAV
jgi:hypothetical protein